MSYALWFWRESLYDFFRMKKKPELRVRVNIRGEASNVIKDLGRFKPTQSDSHVYFVIEAKTAGGGRIESYELPVITNANTNPAKQAIETLYKQTRISKEQYDEANRAIDALASCANEVLGVYEAPRYKIKGSMVD